ncbi:hypothetical protein [Sodalis sp.]
MLIPFYGGNKLEALIGIEQTIRLDDSPAPEKYTAKPDQRRTQAF